MRYQQIQLIMWFVKVSYFNWKPLKILRINLSNQCINLHKILTFKQYNQKFDQVKYLINFCCLFYSILRSILATVEVLSAAACFVMRECLFIILKISWYLDNYNVWACFVKYQYFHVFNSAFQQMTKHTATLIKLWNRKLKPTIKVIFALNFLTNNDSIINPADINKCQNNLFYKKKSWKPKKLSR